MLLSSKCLLQELKKKNSRMHSNHWSSLVTAPQFCMQHKQTAIIFNSHSPFSLSLSRSVSPSIPSPLSCHHLFSGAKNSHQLWWGLHRGLSWIAWELRVSRWLHNPSITSHLPHFSLPTPQWNTSSQAFISLLPDGECFVPPALPSSVPLPAQALPWKITFWGETLIILPAPMHPAPVSSY